MKIYLSFILFVLMNCIIKSQNPPVIDFIITNDYLSARNLSFMGGVMPAGFNKGLQDSLKNSYVEYFKEDAIIQKKYYNSIGAIYHSEDYFYDTQKRLKKIIKTDEFKDETCEINFKYSDTLIQYKQKTTTNLCNNQIIEVFYKYDAEGGQSEILVLKNDLQDSKDEIFTISGTEKKVRNYDEANRLSTFLYRYNDKNLITYEHLNGWNYIKKPDYFQTDQEFEYLYQYDKNGNWTERIKKVFCKPEKKKKTKIKTNDTVKEMPPQVITMEASCEPEIREKLVRKIYYLK